MKAFRIPDFQSRPIDSSVTLLVSAWFLVAGAAIVADPASAYNEREAKAAPAVEWSGIDREMPVTTAAADEGLRPANLVVPAVHYTVTVQARRSAT